VTRGASGETAASVLAGSLVELTVDRPVAGGRMLARRDGQVVLVSGAIPGERVRARVERVSRQVAWAETTDVLTSSPDRRTPMCDPACGGALYAHIEYARQRLLKGEVIADAFRRLGKMDLGPVPVAKSPERGYRMRARLRVRGGRAGFLREGSHTICDAGPTGQLHADTLGAIDVLLGALRNRLADCDSIVIAENVPGTERVLHLEAREGARLDDLCLGLDDLPGATGLTTSVRGRALTLAGSASVTDSAGQLFGSDSPIGALPTWTRHAASFFQANRFLVGPLVRRVLEVSEGDACVDLYSGVGLFAVALAASGHDVVAVEGDRMSGADLESNAVPWRKRLRVVSTSVETFVHAPPGDRPDVIVLDPPRAGVSAEALHALIQWQAPRVVYVSCDPPTLARDAARLTAGGYQLHSMEAFDLFPNTPHVETLAVFTRGRRSLGAKPPPTPSWRAVHRTFVPLRSGPQTVPRISPSAKNSRDAIAHQRRTGQQGSRWLR
jgi:23S rRNA (uracil1939-C5)-methyltransferase